MTIFLKFASETDARAVLTDYLTADGDWKTASHEYALDVVGVIYKPTGEMITNEDGLDSPEMARIPGYHVNFIGELPPEVLAYAVIPTDPVRVFA